MIEHTDKENFIIRERHEKEKVKEANLENEEDSKKKIENNRKYLTNEVLNLLKKGKAQSKRDMTDLLIKNGVKDWIYRYNFITNSTKPEIPELGGVLKKLRIINKIKFRMENGSHTYFIDNMKPLKSKLKNYEFNWSNYKIPQGNNEIYLVFKIPGVINTEHFLASCFPKAQYEGFTIKINKKFAKVPIFHLNRGKEDINTCEFDGDKFIISCSTSEVDIDKSIFTLAQRGRKIIEELLKLNWRFDEVLKINDITMFTPCIPVFRAGEQGAFYKSEYKNIFRYIYDFPKNKDKKILYGRFSILSREKKKEKFDIKDFYDVIEEYFEFEVKSFISSAISQNWIINPRRALNYMKEDEQLKGLIKEYIEDINTDKIMQDRLEEKMEANEFSKEITSNLLLSLLGLSFLANSPPLSLTVIVSFILINVFFFYSRRKKLKEKIL